MNGNLSWMTSQTELDHPGYLTLVQYQISISDIDIQYQFQMNGNLSWMANQVELKYPGYSKLVPDHWVRYPQVQYQHQLSNMIIKYHIRY